MSFDDLTIGEARQLACVFGLQKDRSHGAVGHKCVVRTYASGVHFGAVVSVAENGGRSRCELKNSRRIWSWSGAFTLSEVAMNGIKDGKISTAVPRQFIEDAIEFIPASTDAIKNLEGAKTHEP